jgi:hypothetical protein
MFVLGSMQTDSSSKVNSKLKKAQWKNICDN